MTRLMIVPGLALTLGVSAVALAQARPDFSGTWSFNQEMSSPSIAGDTPSMPIGNGGAVRI